MCICRSEIEITKSRTAELRAAFDTDISAKVAQNAVCSTAVNVVALNRAVIQSTDTSSFGVKVDSWAVTNQKSSGRCWLFATLNLLRMNAMKRLKVKDFEFSQSYIHFWDKFERANHFLEAILETADRPLGDRTVDYLLGDPIGDGGQWGMAVNLIRKHGLVPKSVFPESVSSSATMLMNRNLKNILRTAARELRNIASEQSIDAARVQKQSRLADIWRLLCIHLGTPPDSFRWSWTDKDNVQHRVNDGGPITPQEFCAQFACPPADSDGCHYEDYVCIVNDPRNEFLQTYSVEYLQSVIRAPPVVYLNVDMQTMKNLTRRQLESDMGVWMGCDVGKQLHRLV